MSYPSDFHQIRKHKMAEAKKHTWSFRKNGTLIPELAEHDSGLNGTSISDKTERLSVY